jgi:hypothetical protein
MKIKKSKEQTNEQDFMENLCGRHGCYFFVNRNGSGANIKDDEFGRHIQHSQN